MISRFCATACLGTSALLGLTVLGCNSSGPSNDTFTSVSSSGVTITAGTDDTGDTTGGTATATTTVDSSGSMSQGSMSTDDTGTGTATDDATGTTVSTSGETDSSDSSTSSPMTATTGGVVPCDIANAVLEPVPPNIMLVLDKSGSMITNEWDHDADPNTPTVTRWNSLYQVVDFVVTTFDDQINFGANLFPSEAATQTYTAQACVVANQPEIPVAAMNANAILAGIPAANDVDLFGGTPATAGIIAARDHLLSLAPQNPRAMIFITDGAANCSADAATNFERFEEYDDQLPVEVGSAWTDENIPTYVVGIDIENALTGGTQDGNPNNINPYDKLNEVANAGGKPKGGAEDFYQTTNQIELQDALQQIVDDALSCTVPLNPEPAFPELLEVYIDNMMVPEIVDCNSEDGWVYTNPNGPYDSIELCGTWCDQLKLTGELTAEYYCDPG